MSALDAKANSVATGSAKAFGRLQRIAAGAFDVGYVDIGPPGGRAVLLLHGWPYDVYSYADVAPPLAAAGYRVLVPYLRGYGVTRFLSGDAPRNGQQSVLAVDAIASRRRGGDSTMPRSGAARPRLTIPTMSLSSSTTTGGA